MEQASRRYACQILPLVSQTESLQQVLIMKSTHYILCKILSHFSLIFCLSSGRFILVVCVLLVFSLLELSV